MQHQMRYAGVGSRQTPERVRRLMRKTASWLATKHWILRSGGARGADMAFQSGATNFVRPPRYEVWTIDHRCEAASEGRAKKPTRGAWERAHMIAGKVHPAWSRCSRLAQALHARNTLILLGHEITTPVRFVLCWTPGGKETGGTGQMIRLARMFQVNVLNFADHQDEVLSSTISRWQASPPNPSIQQEYLVNMYTSLPTKETLLTCPMT